MSEGNRAGKGEPSAISPLWGRCPAGQKGGKPSSSDIYFQKPDLDDMGRDVATPAGADQSLFRRNTLDEMTVGRTEKPVIGHVPEKPILTRAKPGVGSYEDPADEKRQKGRTKGKTGRPGR
ncbi:hypothetical protein V7S54_05860 [Ensifer sp. CCNWLY38]|nr:hypothetical protein [Ensifer adhaerens]